MTAPISNEHFPQFSAITDPQGQQTLAQAKIVELPANTTIFRQGDRCPDYLLVLDGSVRVFARAENGREIVLYRIGEGGSCVLTTTCLLGKRRYPAEGVTETAVKALAIPANIFHQGLSVSPSLREFVFASYGERLADLIVLIEEVSFSRIDVRLARHLLEQADAANKLNITHQALAIELGSAREVISRQLKEFERREYIRTHRGEITLLLPEKLQELAHQI